MMRRVVVVGVLVLLLFGAGIVSAAEETVAYSPADVAMYTANNVWMMVSIFLVFVMHLGFATVEAGLTRAKNTVNILFKNTAIVAIGLLTYTLIGFNLMYPGDSWLFGKVLGFAGMGVSCPEGVAGGIAYAGGNYSYWTDFLFQGMFAATAATIVSGAVAERIKLGPFLVFSAIYVMLVYPFVGSWKWGGGWLAEMGFHDFAGSTLVHSVGGWAALAGVMLLGPRFGKYVNGTIKPIMGHNMPLLTIGVFLLWLGWFGFNGGSVLSADATAVPYVLTTTSLAAAAGIIGSMCASWIIQKKPDLSMVLNGCLAGLVGITAGADILSIRAAVIVGLVCGAVAVMSVMLFDRLRADDPVGATTVHLVCGILGTLFVGVFANGTVVGEGADAYTISLGVQLLGIAAYALVCFPAAFLIFKVLKVTVGIRVSEEEELEGKELIARAIQSISPRKNNAFICVNCAALPENLIESELFGHEKGAFTGAMSERKGRFEMANGGTLFLDEIGDISPSVQVRLLRVLQEQAFERVGSDKTTSVNVRVITATSSDLEEAIKEGKFREDLYYRLNVFPIHLPSLRERRSDIMMLADHFIQKYNEAYNKKIQRISTAAINMIMAYHWPGNVRELENCIERAVLTCTDNVIHGYSLPPSLQTSDQTNTEVLPTEGASLKGLLEAYEREIIIDALKKHRGNASAAAKELNATQRIINYSIKRLAINPQNYK